MKSTKTRSKVAFALIALLMGLLSGLWGWFSAAVLYLNTGQYLLTNTAICIIFGLLLTKIPYAPNRTATYKGKSYYVWGRAIDKSNNQEIVLYEDSNGRYYTRALQEFRDKFTCPPNLEI